MRGIRKTDFCPCSDAPSRLAQHSTLLQGGCGAFLCLVQSLRPSPSYTLSCRQTSAFGCRYGCATVAGAWPNDSFHASNPGRCRCDQASGHAQGCPCLGRTSRNRPTPGKPLFHASGSLFDSADAWRARACRTSPSLQRRTRDTSAVHGEDTRMTSTCRSALSGGAAQAHVHRSSEGATFRWMSHSRALSNVPTWTRPGQAVLAFGGST